MFSGMWMHGEMLKGSRSAELLEGKTAASTDPELLYPTIISQILAQIYLHLNPSHTAGRLSLFKNITFIHSGCKYFRLGCDLRINGD